MLWGKRKKTQFVTLKSNVDLGLLENQFIYVEGEYDARVNSAIRRLYSSISMQLKDADPDADFIYLPLITEQLQTDTRSLTDCVAYYFPNQQWTPVDCPLKELPSTAQLSQHFFSLCSYPDPINPGFLRFLNRDTDGGYLYAYFMLAHRGAGSFDKQIQAYIDTIAYSDSITTLKEVPPQHVVGQVFEKFLMSESCSMKSPEALDLINRIKSDIENLKAMGFYEVLLKEIGASLLERKQVQMFQPSRLFIDEQFRILLTDFHEMEILMTPLPKTLFFLFLRHPEGILLKSLIDYKTELMEIYKLLSFREQYVPMDESISRICNPAEGSVNEKISRVKEAFLKKMSMDTAQYYLIEGDRGMKKKILLDRSLVVFPEALERIQRTVVAE